MFASGSLSTDLDGNKVNNDQQLLETIASFVNGDQAETEEHESETREDDNNIIDDDRNFALDDSMTSSAKVCGGPGGPCGPGSLVP